MSNRWGNWFKSIRGSAFQLSEKDIVVFVVGPSGSGKSTFVRAVTQASGYVEVGQSIRASAKNVQAIRCELTDTAQEALGAKEQRNIVFVDVPSFHIDLEENSKAEKEMRSWLEKSQSTSTRVGVIYMHRIEMDPAAEKEHPMQDHLNTFVRTFPPGFVKLAPPERLHCVFSYVDEIKEEKIINHKANFENQLGTLKAKSVHGAKLIQWNTSTHPDLFIKGDPLTAWNAVERLFLRPP